MTDKLDMPRPWARSSLRIESTALSVAEIGRRMGQPTSSPKAKNCWLADLEPDKRMPLNDQLPVVEQFIADKLETLEELAATCEIDLYLGWHPEAGQDGIVLERSLIELLNRIKANVVLDTYTESKDGEEDDPPAE